MKTSSRSLPLLFTLALFPPAGCRFTTRKLPVPQAPPIVQTATADDLAKQLDDRWAALKGMYANVEIQARLLKTKEGLEKDITPFPAIILMRKPEMLRVDGRVPILQTQLFSMVSDGQNFTLHIPSRQIAYQGRNEVIRKSDDLIENMRPGFFFDALVVRGLSTDDFYTQTANLETIESADKKHLLAMPEYVLSITQRAPGSRREIPVRVVIFHRDDLLPYQQDLYDRDGNLETDVSYSKYADFGGGQYPSVIKIWRPVEQCRIILTVEKVTEIPEPELKPEQFHISLPDGTAIKRLE